MVQIREEAIRPAVFRIESDRAFVELSGFVETSLFEVGTGDSDDEVNVIRSIGTALEQFFKVERVEELQMVGLLFSVHIGRTRFEKCGSLPKASGPAHQSPPQTLHPEHQPPRSGRLRFRQHHFRQKLNQFSDLRCLPQRLDFRFGECIDNLKKDRRLGLTAP